MLTGLQADIGIQLCRGDVLRQTASSLMTYHTVIQMRQRMRVSSSFFYRKKPENAPLILNFPPLFETTEHQDRGELRS